MSDDKNRTSKDSFDRITNPDGTPVRDKDNAAPELKPSYAPRPAQNLAPPGMMGIRQRPAATLVPQTQPQLTIDSNFTSDTHRYVTGHYSAAPNIEFMARVSHTPTDKGINGSHVDQLVLKQDGQSFVRHNFIAEDADLAPQTDVDKKMMDQVCKELDGDRRQLQDINITPDKAQSPDKAEKIQFRQEDDAKIDFRGNKSDLVPSRDDANKSSDIVVEKEFVTQRSWQKGKITSMPGHSFVATVYDKPSKYGIDGGQISKLEVREFGKVILDYDRGWKVPPKTGAEIEAVNRIRVGLEDKLQQHVKAPEQKPDKDHGVDR